MDARGVTSGTESQKKGSVVQSGVAAEGLESNA